MLEIRGAQEHELESAARCVGEAFFAKMGLDVDGIAEDFLWALTHDTVYNPANTRIAMLDGQVVSVVQIADRQMLVNGVVVRQGFINWAGTHPAYQNRGYGGLLLWDAARFMADSGYLVSMIPGEGVEPFYERNGWRNFQHYHKLTLHLPSPLSVAPSERQIGPLDWSQGGDLQQVMVIHQRYNQAVSGPTVRTAEFWQAFQDQRQADYPLFEVAVAGGEVIAFLRYGNNRLIAEIGCRPGAEEALWALVLHGCQQAQAAGQTALESILLPDWLRQRLEAAGVMLVRERVGGSLYRLLHLRGLFQALLPQMQARITEAGLDSWSGVILVKSEADSATLHLSEGRLTVQDMPPAREPTLWLRATHGQLVDLLFGQADVGSLWFGGQPDSATVVALLETIFPPHPFYWYTKDAL